MTTTSEVSSEQQSTTSSSNNTNINIPKYLLDQFERIAKENNFIDYKFEFDDGSKHADGFVATMLNVVITGSKKQSIDGEIKTNQRLSLICKLTPDNVARREFFSTEKIFVREAYAYNVLLPTFIEFQKEKQIPIEKSFLHFPHCYYACSDETKKEYVIIMEDLRSRDFALWDKLEPITYGHVKSLLIALGRFHGLSFALKDQRPDKFNEFRKLNNLIIDVFLKQPTMVDMFSSGFENSIKMFESTDIGEIMKSLKKDWLKGYTESLVADEKFSVVAHGDCWNNNMMFDKNKDATILDWQTFSFGSPAEDFAHFILSSTLKELRTKHMDEFLKIYYDSLAEMIRLCGSDPDKLYHFYDFQQQLKKSGQTILYLMPTMVGVLVTDPKNIIKMDDMADNMKNSSATPDFIIGNDENINTKIYQRLFDVFTDAIAYGWIEVPKKPIIPEYLLEQFDRIAKENEFIDYRFEYDAGSKHADGFVATMLNVVIKGTKKSPITGDLKLNEKLSLICKLAPDNQARRELFNIDLIFERETYAYNVLLPTLIEFQKVKKIPEEKLFSEFPRCLYAISDNEKNQHVIIMEDLRSRGFALWDKLKPITYDHVKSLLISLGRFHGLSFALKDQRPEKFKEFQKLDSLLIKIITKQPNMLQMFTTGFDKIIPMFESTDIGEILKNMNKNWLEQMSALLTPAGPFSVVEHGDCWNNNMMFNQQKEVSILDWQTFQYGSPAEDVGHFILSSTLKELRAKHIDEFLQIYYDSLAEMIRLCGSNSFKLYSFNDFQKELKKHARTILYMMPSMVGILIADPKDIVKMEDLAENLQSNNAAAPEFLVSGSENLDGLIHQRISDVFTDAIEYGWIEVPKKI